MASSNASDFVDEIEEDDDLGNVECGFCCTKKEEITDPRTLPCSHVHCLQCLTGSYEHGGVIQCPLSSCREVFDIALERLPRYVEGGDNSLCSICLEKHLGDNRAVVYCMTCCKKYCSKHQQFHDEVLEEHPKIAIDDYLVQANKLQDVLCEEHPSQPYIISCSECLSVFCVQCIGDTSSCTGGKSHRLTVLRDVVSELTKEIDHVKADMIYKEEKLSSLFKTTSKIIGSYQKQTEEMIKTMRQTRDDQMEAIRLKYAKLERDLVELRKKSEQEMTEFLEFNVGAKLCEISRHRLNMEARLKHSHQVEIVTKYRDTKDEIQVMIEEELPSLEIDGQGVLMKTDEHRDVELQVVWEEKGDIEWASPLSTCAPKPPKSVTLLKNLSMNANARSICLFNGDTYVGVDNYTVSRISSSYQVVNSIGPFGSFIEGISLYNSRMYVLVFGNPLVVHVRDLAGNSIKQWNHTDTTGAYGNSLVVMSGQIVVPDRTNKRLTVYSLEGSVIKQVLCPQLSADYVRLCRASGDSVIVTDYNSSSVFRVNIATNEVVWTCTSVPRPEGVAVYRRNYVCVYSQSNARVHILDMKTGAAVCEITDGNLTGNILDLQIVGDTLVVQKYNTPSVLFYKLDK